MTESSHGTFAGLESDEPYPGIVRRAFDSQGATVTSYTFTPGATFPRHRHPQEQVTLILEGEVTMLLGEGQETLTAGAWSVVAGGVEHGITAGSEGARIAAILVPRRASTASIEVAE